MRVENTSERPTPTPTEASQEFLKGWRRRISTAKLCFISAILGGGGLVISGLTTGRKEVVLLGSTVAVLFTAAGILWSSENRGQKSK